MFVLLQGTRKFIISGLFMEATSLMIIGVTPYILLPKSAWIKSRSILLFRGNKMCVYLSAPHLQSVDSGVSSGDPRLCHSSNWYPCLLWTTAQGTVSTNSVQIYSAHYSFIQLTPPNHGGRKRCSHLYCLRDSKFLHVTWVRVCFCTFKIMGDTVGSFLVL